jgi:hypothetical protein
MLKSLFKMEQFRAYRLKKIPLPSIWSKEFPEMLTDSAPSAKTLAPRWIAQLRTQRTKSITVPERYLNYHVHYASARQHTYSPPEGISYCSMYV